MADSTTWRARLLDWLNQPDCRPLNKSELARAFGAKPDERAGLRQAIAALLEEGKLEPRKGGRYGPPGAKSDVARGIFETNWRGNHSVKIVTGGHVLRPGPDGTRRIEIAESAAGTALPGDMVEIRLKRKPRPPTEFREFTRGGRDEGQDYEGRVVGVVQEGRRSTTGIYRRQGKRAFIEVEDKKFPPLLDVAEIAPGAKPEPGQLVLVSIIRWDASHHPPLARVTRVLGHPGAAGNDVLALMHRFDLAADFPDAVLQEARAFPEEVDLSTAGPREDWRDRLVITIDPFDARDFDDAIHVTARPDGGWLLAVHIADVSHYVKPGTALDAEARERGNSTYLVDRVLPMLPESLSNGLCSLVPGRDRLTRLVEMEISTDGKITSSRLASAIIRSARRFTYEEVFQFLQMKEEHLAGDPATAMLPEAWRMAERLRKRRFREGSLDLDFPEVKVILDRSGRPIELRKIENDISHQLVEECMLAANETVATILRRAGMACTHRVHEDPDEGKLSEFRELARLHGFGSAPGDGRAALKKLLLRIKGQPEEHALKLSLLKSLKRARYAAEPLGHYGLAKANYLHFTSPIRRYSDLVAHRVAGAWFGHQPRLTTALPKPDELAEISAHLSETERVSAEAEMESRRLKEIEYFENLLEAKEPVVFPAVVTDARRNGLLIQLVDLQVKGLVPAGHFPPGSWWFENTARRWKAGRGSAELKAGAKINVRVLRVDRDNRFLDFACVEEKPTRKKSSP
jgi:ribonuclease R